MESAPILYDLIEQLERIAGALEKLSDKPTPEQVFPKASAIETKPKREACLSLFLEALPTWNYNCLRRKLLPASLAAKLLGISSGQLTSLTQNGLIKNKGGRYDLLSLLMWLDEEANPSGVAYEN